MEESLLKTNFIGRDGFVWWVGQIAKEESWAEQASGGGWGVRYKVRIMGYHPTTEAELKDEDLPWAQVMLNNGTGSANVFKTVKYNQGDVVIGFFLDGDNAQLPVIMGAFGNSIYSTKDEEVGPFKSFTGYTGTMKKPSKSVLKASESGDQSNKSQESPKNLPAQKAKQVDPENPATYTSTDGFVIDLPCDDDEKDTSGVKKVINKVKTVIEEFVDWIQRQKAKFDEGIEYYRDWIKQEIDTRADQLANLLSGLISGMINGAMEKLIPILSKGLDMLFNSVFAKVLAATGNAIVAYAAGVAAQTAMIGPVKAMQQIVECIVNQVVAKILQPIKDILKSVADNVLNFADCIADQTVGAMINGIISFVTEGILPALNGISKILQFFDDFSFDNLIRNSIDALLGLVGLRSCAKPPQKDKYGACKYRLGCGPVKQDMPDLDGILKNVNVANAAAIAANVSGFPLDGVQDIVGAYDVFSKTISDPASEFLGDVDSCFGGIPTLCGPPKINIFGGGGEGGAASAIMGLGVGEGSNRTGSVISVQVTNPGNGYTFPPFVEVVDNCNQGYGCVARATIKDGKIDTIYVVSEGENYPIDEEDPYVVDNVSIINPGNGYEEDDIITDNLGNQYKADIYLGSIIKVTPINSKDITDIPVISVKTATGSGALLSANLGPRRDFQGEVQQVIDCVT
jgi:hypothetical protein